MKITKQTTTWICDRCGAKLDIAGGASDGDPPAGWLSVLWALLGARSHVPYVTSDTFRFVGQGLPGSSREYAGHPAVFCSDCAKPLLAALTAGRPITPECPAAIVAPDWQAVITENNSYRAVLNQLQDLLSAAQQPSPRRSVADELTRLGVLLDELGYEDGISPGATLPPRRPI